jgi:prepilin-type N-terminal cleavage/methylation domain-containing protein/prepilin-type processing-associated H-X9-DG protein
MESEKSASPVSIHDERNFVMCTGFAGGAGKVGRERHAFTIIELLVVTAMIGVLAAMLVPAINVARESSRKAACQSNLRQLGLGLSIYAQNHQGFYCTGAFDWARDGAVTEIGWVADLVNQGIPVGKMLCPSNPAMVAETFNDLLTEAVTVTPCVDRLGKPGSTLPDGTEQVNPCRQIVVGSMAPGSEQRRLLVQEQILDKFYNTNYTASWLLVRSRPLLDASGNVTTRKSACAASLLTRTSTAGPLSQAVMDSCSVAAANVPFLGCGTTSGSLAQDLGEYPSGTFVTQSFTAGPLMVTSGQRPAFGGGTSRLGANGWWAVWMKHTLQDYRGFAPVHRNVCNVLMADGSVRSFEDTNQDGFLNNGFASGSGVFQSDDLELPGAVVYSGAALRSL